MSLDVYFADLLSHHAEAEELILVRDHAAPKPNSITICNRRNNPENLRKQINFCQSKACPLPPPFPTRVASSELSLPSLQRRRKEAIPSKPIVSSSATRMPYIAIRAPIAPESTFHSRISGKCVLRSFLNEVVQNSSSLHSDGALKTNSLPPSYPKRQPSQDSFLSPRISSTSQTSGKLNCQTNLSVSSPCEAQLVSDPLLCDVSDDEVDEQEYSNPRTLPPRFQLETKPSLAQEASQGQDHRLSSTLHSY